MTKMRLWVCPECGVVRAYLDYEFQTPLCYSHTEKWPDGEYARSVPMKKTNTIVEVEE